MSDPKQWQVSGNAPQAYERYMVPTLFIPWAQKLLARAALHAGERVLDVACGTGCVFRAKVATDSGRTLPPIPVEGCHPFRLKVATDSG